MSLPWNKTLRLHIEADAMHATLHAGRNDQVIAQITRVYDPSALLEVLQELITDLLAKANKSRPTLIVTVSIDIAHFDIAEGDFSYYGEPQLDAIATGCISEVLGEGPVPMEIRWQLQPDLRHILLCALDSQLVHAVTESARLHRLELASLQPVFCHYWNKYSTPLRHAKGIFALQDSERALVCISNKGSITSLSYGPAARSDLDQPANGRAKSPLDLRVDRLLTSTGAHADAIDHYLLVTQGAHDLSPHPRWNVINIGEPRK